MINTVCMLGLDAFDPFLFRLAEHGKQININSVLSYDSFGITPLGWALLPRSQFGNYPGAKSFTCPLESFEDGLQRAERLIEVFRVLDPVEPMWDTDALALIRNTLATYSRNGHRIKYSFSTPFLFLLDNCLSAPGATQRCVSQIENYTNITFWSSFRRSPRTCSHPTWSLLMLRTEPNIHRERFMEPKESIENKVSTKAPWVAEDDNDGERRRSVLTGVRCMTAFFEPASSVPLLFIPDWLQDRCRLYCHSRDDVMQEATQRLPETLCWVYMLRREALLHVGAASDSVGMVNYALFKYKVDANGSDNKGQTALQVALNLGSNSAADILIRHGGIDMSVRDSKDATLLHVCVRHEQTGFASIILGKHPELINAGDQLGKTALHYAVSKPSSRMVKLLLVNGADVNIDDAAGNTPLHEAILKQDAFICNILMESQSGDKFSARNLQRAWNLAFEAGASFIMTLLRALQSNSSKLLTAGDDQTSSALSYSKRTLALLLANENTPDFTEADLAFMMELSRDPQVSGSASLSMISANAATTILTAMIKGAGNVAAFLLRRFPIDLHCFGQDGESVLHLAVIYDAHPVVKLLLDNDGTDFALLDPQGHTALTLALMHKRLQVLQMLLDCPRVQFGQITSNGATPLHLAIVHRFSNAIPLLLAHPQVPTNQLDGSGRTPLHRAVMQQDSAVVRLLLECPRVISETPSGDGRTALAYAAQYADEEMVSLLLNTRKFDVMQRDTYGKTALEWARLNTSSRVWSAIKQWRDNAPV
jgi:ankyrin repeat protein